MTFKTSSDFEQSSKPSLRGKGKENYSKKILSPKTMDFSTNSPLKSEFKTSEEIKTKCNNSLWNKGNSLLVEELIDFDKKLWLSKEDYEKRVEEFRKEIHVVGMFHHRTPERINDLINKILLGGK